MSEPTSDVYMFLRGFARTVWIISNVFYAIPTFVFWMLLLHPLSVLLPQVYRKMEKIGYSWMSYQVALWCWSAGYTVSEAGDNVSECASDECLVMANHQSTGDVPLMMYATSHKNKPFVAHNAFWIMDWIFCFLPFGWISRIHGDFFIKQGKDTRSSQLVDLQQHIRNIYVERDRKWIFVFPEGGFLRKRLARSQEYAKKNGYPVLQYSTLPRLGAVSTILNELMPTGSKVTNGFNTARAADKKPLKWIIDITICYPNSRPLDIYCILFGHRPACNTVLYYRRYRADDVPCDQEELTSWLFDRWQEKDKMLEKFYASGDKASFENESETLKVDVVKCLAINTVLFISTLFHLYMIRSLVGGFMQMLF